MKTFNQYLTEQKGCCAELASALMRTKTTRYDGIDKIMTRIADKHDISPKDLHDEWMKEYKMTPDKWIKDRLK